MGKLLTEGKKSYNKDRFEKCSLCQLTCPHCNKKYTGQMGRPFHIRFQEHFHDYKYGNNKSKFVHHLLNSRHAISPMESITDIIYITNKNKMLNTMEKFYIYIETKTDNQLNDKCTVKPNKIFDMLILKDTDRAHITP